jgi:putative methyltransferase (TIGR04325 family)
MSFSSYAEAVKVSSLDAYQNQELVEVIFRKTKACIQTMQAGQYSIDATSAFSSIALLNIASNKETINVIDLGGACGLHYFSARLMLPNKTRIAWRVVETTTMAQRAKN